MYSDFSTTTGARGGGSGGGWDTGKNLNQMASEGDDEDEQKSLIPSGACGAFVTALEDEFMSEFHF